MYGLPPAKPGRPVPSKHLIQQVFVSTYQSRTRVLTAVGALLSACLLQSCNTNQAATGGAASMPPPTVSAITASASDVPLTIAAVGNGEAMSSVDVKSRVTGQVLRVAFTDG